MQMVQVYDICWVENMAIIHPHIHLKFCKVTYFDKVFYKVKFLERLVNLGNQSFMNISQVLRHLAGLDAVLWKSTFSQISVLDWPLSLSYK